MAIPNDYKDIVETLSTATNEGRVKWTATTFGLQVALSGSRFTLWAGNDVGSERGFVAFSLSDHDGKTLDAWNVDEGNTEYDFMYRLYTAAKRKALELPQRLANIREEIKKSDIIGETTAYAEKEDLPS